MVPWYASTYRKTRKRDYFCHRLVESQDLQKGGIFAKKGSYRCLTEDTSVTPIKGAVALVRILTYRYLIHIFYQSTISFSRDCFRILPCLQFILRVWVHKSRRKWRYFFLVVKSTNRGYLLYLCTCMGTGHHVEPLGIKWPDSGKTWKRLNI